MDAVDRYLREVKFWLPRSQRDDIIAELAEDLRSEIEERGSELDRPLTESELKALLAERGSPLNVARRYAPDAELIGPSLFPIYWRVLKWTVLFWLLPAELVGLGLIIYDTLRPSDAIQMTWTGLLSFPAVVGAYAFAVITLTFAGLEWSRRRAKSRAGWHAPGDPNQIVRWESAAELMAALVITLFWLRIVPFPTQLDESTRMTFGPVGRAFYYPLLLCFLGSAAVGLAKLRLQRWTANLARLRLAVSALHVVTFVLILAAVAAGGRLVTIVAANARESQIASGEKWLTLMWGGVILGYLIGYISTVVKDLRRVRRMRQPPATAVHSLVVLLITLILAFGS